MRHTAPVNCEHRVSLRLQREATAFLASPGTADPRLSLRIRDEGAAVAVRGFECCVFKFRVPHDAPPGMLDFGGPTPLVYGRPVMIVHEMSGLYVAVDKAASESFPGCCQIRLVSRESAGVASLFRVLPKFKVRTEGDVVFSNDAIHIVHESSRLALHVSTVQHGGVIDDILSEVNCHDETTSFEVSIYDDNQQLLAQAQGGDQAFAPLRCGRAFAIFHRERESFLSIESPTMTTQLPLASDASASSMELSPPPMNAEDVIAAATSFVNAHAATTSSSDPYSSATAAAAGGGGEGENSTAAEAMLAVNTIVPRFEQIVKKDVSNSQSSSSSTSTTGGESSVASPTAASAAAANDPLLQATSPIMAAASLVSLDVPNTFWLMERADPTVGGPLRVNVRCRLRHIVTNRYLVARTNPVSRKLEMVLEYLSSFEDMEQSVFAMEHVLASTDTNVCDADLVLLGRSLIVFRHTGTGMYLSCSSDETCSIALSPAPSLEDAITLMNIPREYQRSVQFLLGNCEFLRDYIHLWYKSQRDGIKNPNDFFRSPVVRRNLDHAKAALTSLVRHCTASMDDDPLTREGLPIPTHQQAMFEIALYKLAFEVLVCPFVSADRTNKLTLPLEGGILSLSDLGTYDQVYLICRLCYRLLKQMSKQCKLSSVLVEYVDFMLSQEGHKLHVADTLGEIFTDNPDLPAARCRVIIRHFVKNLQKSRSSGYVIFLAELCVVNGRGCTHNQKYVVDQLAPVADKIFLKLLDELDHESKNPGLDFHQDNNNNYNNASSSSTAARNAHRLLIEVPPEKDKDKNKNKEKTNAWFNTKEKKEKGEKEKEKEKHHHHHHQQPKPTIMPLREFVVERANSKIERFFRSSIELLGAVSVGNEPSALHLVRKILPVDRIFLMLSSHFPHVASLRQACLQVLRHAYFSEWLHFASLYPERLFCHSTTASSSSSSSSSSSNNNNQTSFSAMAASSMLNLSSAESSWTHCGSLFLREVSREDEEAWHMRPAQSDVKRKCAEVLNIVLHYYSEAASHDFDFCVELARLLRVFAQSAKETGAHNPNITHATIATIVTASISILKIRVVAEGRHVKNEKSWPAIQMLHEVLVTLRDFIEYALITTSQIIGMETEATAQNEAAHNNNKSSSASSSSFADADNMSGSFFTRKFASGNDLNANAAATAAAGGGGGGGGGGGNSNNNNRKNDSNNKDDDNNNGGGGNNNRFKERMLEQGNACLDILEKDVFCTEELLPLLIEVTLYDSPELVSVALEVVDLLCGAKSFCATQLEKFRVVPSEYVNAFRLLCCASQRILASHSPCSTGLLPESQEVLCDLVEVLTDIDRDDLLNDTHSSKAARLREALLEAWYNPDKQTLMKPLLKDWMNPAGENAHEAELELRSSSSLAVAREKPCNSLFALMLTLSSVVSSLVKCFVSQVAGPELRKSLLRFFSVASIHPFIAKELRESDAFNEIQRLLPEYTVPACRTIFNIVSHFPRTAEKVNASTFTRIFETTLATKNVTMARGIELLLLSDFPIEQNQKLFLTACEKHHIGSFIHNVVVAKSATAIAAMSFPGSLGGPIGGGGSSSNTPHPSPGGMNKMNNNNNNNNSSSSSSGKFEQVSLGNIEMVASGVTNSSGSSKPGGGDGSIGIFLTGPESNDNSNNNNTQNNLLATSNSLASATYPSPSASSAAAAAAGGGGGGGGLSVGVAGSSANNLLSPQHSSASGVYPSGMTSPASPHIAKLAAIAAQYRHANLNNEGATQASEEIFSFTETLVNLIACSCVNEQSRAHVATRLVPLPLVMRVLSGVRTAKPNLLQGMCKFAQTVVFGGEVSKPSIDQTRTAANAPIHATIREWNTNPEWFGILNSLCEYVEEWSALLATMEHDQFLCLLQGIVPLVVTYFVKIYHPPLANDTKNCPHPLRGLCMVDRFLEAFVQQVSSLSWSASLSVLSEFPAEMLRTFGFQLQSCRQQLIDAANLLNTSFADLFSSSRSSSPTHNFGSSASGGYDPAASFLQDFQSGKAESGFIDPNMSFSSMKLPSFGGGGMLDSSSSVGGGGGGGESNFLSGTIRGGMFASSAGFPGGAGSDMMSGPGLQSSTAAGGGSMFLSRALSNLRNMSKGGGGDGSSFGFSAVFGEAGRGDGDGDAEILTSAFSSQPLFSLKDIIQEWEGEGGKHLSLAVALLLAMEPSTILQTAKFPDQQQQQKEQEKLKQRNRSASMAKLKTPNTSGSGSGGGVGGNGKDSKNNQNEANNNNNNNNKQNDSSKQDTKNDSSPSSTSSDKTPPTSRVEKKHHLPPMAAFQLRHPFLHRILRKIVNHMLQNDLSSPGAAAALELFCALCEVAQEAAESEEAYSHFQTYLEGLGALRMVTEVLRTSFSNDIRKKTIRFGIATLQGGNKTVQDRLLHFFNTTDEVFFRECKRHVGTSTQTLHHHRVRLRYRNFYACAALSVGPLAVMNYLGLIDAAPQKETTAADEFTVALLRFLQLMAEGHHRGLQDYMRSQGDNFMSINVVALVQSFFSELVADFEPETASDIKYEMLNQVLELLIEVCQGPCVGNQQILVFNGVCQIVRRLLKVDIFCNEDFRSAAGDMLGVQKNCVILLQALLEGQKDSRVPLRVIHEVPVSTFDVLLARLSRRMSLHETIMKGSAEDAHQAAAELNSNTTTNKNNNNNNGINEDDTEEEDDDDDEKETTTKKKKNEEEEKEKEKEKEGGGETGGVKKKIDAGTLHSLRLQEDVEFEAISSLITDVIYGSVIALHTTVQLIPSASWAAAQCADAEALLAKYSNSVGRLGMIEIERNNEIERVFFRVPEVCEMLSDEAKQELLWNIDRSSQGSKLYDLLDRSDAIIYELDVIRGLHQFWQRVNPYVDVLMNKVPLRAYDNAILANAILINILCVFFADAKGLLDVDVEWFGWEGFLRGLAYTQMILTCLVFSMDALVNIPLTVYHNRKKEETAALKASKKSSNNSNSQSQQQMQQQQNLIQQQQQQQQQLSSSSSSSSSSIQLGGGSQLGSHHHHMSSKKSSGRLRAILTRASKFVSRASVYARAGMSRIETTSRLASVCVSVLGLYWNDLWFSIHLLGFIAKSAILKNVIQAVTLNGTSLILTAMLGGILVYLFSIIGFVLFSDHFEDACSTLSNCVIHILSTGLRQGGGVGDLMTQVKQGDSRYGSRVVYDTLFWAFMIVVFLNILFGIIIDTFAELRDAKSKKEEDMQTRCLVCGLDAFTLDRYGNGFEEHCDVEHCVWNYLYFLQHLRNKPRDLYNGQEQFVCDCVDRGAIDFFPVGKCTSLKAYLARGGDVSLQGDNNDDDDGDDSKADRNNKNNSNSNDNNDNEDGKKEKGGKDKRNLHQNISISGGGGGGVGGPRGDASPGDLMSDASFMGAPNQNTFDPDFQQQQQQHASLDPEQVANAVMSKMQTLLNQSSSSILAAAGAGAGGGGGYHNNQQQHPPPSLASGVPSHANLASAAGGGGGGGSSMPSFANLASSGSGTGVPPQLSGSNFFHPPQTHSHSHTHHPHPHGTSSSSSSSGPAEASHVDNLPTPTQHLRSAMALGGGEDDPSGVPRPLDPSNLSFSQQEEQRQQHLPPPSTAAIPLSQAFSPAANNNDASSSSSSSSSSNAVITLQKEITTLQEALAVSESKKLEIMRKMNKTFETARDQNYLSACLMDWNSSVTHHFAASLGFKTECFYESCVAVKLSIFNKITSINSSSQPSSTSSSTSSSSSIEGILSSRYQVWNELACDLLSDYTCRKISSTSSDFSQRPIVTSTSARKSTASSKRTRSPALASAAASSSTNVSATSTFWQNKTSHDLLNASNDYLRQLEQAARTGSSSRY